MQKICVYCASSDDVSATYKNVARNLGKLLVNNGFEIIYGGGSIGLMGCLADAALEINGKVTGVIPKFMLEKEWGHKGVNLIEVENMHERKKLMLELADAVIALPGGCGTFEEILEAITWKRLSIFSGPAFILNTNGYYNHLINQLELAIKENFMNASHRNLWEVIDCPEDFFIKINKMK